MKYSRLLRSKNYKRKLHVRKKDGMNYLYNASDYVTDFLGYDMFYAVKSSNLSEVQRMLNKKQESKILLINDKDGHNIIYHALDKISPESNIDSNEIKILFHLLNIFNYIDINDSENNIQQSLENISITEYYNDVKNFFNAFFLFNSLVKHKDDISDSEMKLLIWYGDVLDNTADKNKMGHLNLKIFLSLNYFITCFIVFK